MKYKRGGGREASTPLSGASNREGGWGPGCRRGLVRRDVARCNLDLVEAASGGGDCRGLLLAGSREFPFEPLDAALEGVGLMPRVTRHKVFQIALQSATGYVEDAENQCGAGADALEKFQGPRRNAANGSGVVVRPPEGERRQYGEQQGAQQRMELHLRSLL